MRRILLLPALLTAAACANKEGGDAGAGATVPAVVGASVAPAAAQRFVETVDAVGSVVPRVGHVAVLSAPAPTRVTHVYVSLGARVRSGEPLVEFDQLPFDAAAKSAEAALSAAERGAQRAQRLADAGVLPRKDADAAAADLAQARANEVNAQRARTLSTLRSPLNGVVTRISAVLGASVDPTQPMVEVADPSTLDVTLTLSPSDAAKVRRGQDVALHRGAAASAAPVADGRVADISAAVDSASRGVPVRVTVDRTSEPLDIGATVFGRIAVGAHDNAVVVPLESLVPAEDGFKVFVVDDSGIAHARVVGVGGRSDRGAWIAKGLKAGERVVTTGAYGVDDSAKVVTGKP